MKVASLLASCWRGVWDFWSKPIRAEPLALFRILMGVTLLCSLASGFGRSLAKYAGPDGMIVPYGTDSWLERTGRISLLRGPVSVPLLGDWLPDGLAERFPYLNKWVSDDAARAWAEWGATLQAHYLLFALFVLSLVLMTLGQWTRLSTFAALLLASTFHHRFSELMNGGDGLMRNALYFLVLSPAGAVWSLDHWRRRRRALARGAAPPDEPVLIAPWSVRLMQIQLCVMYLFTGMVKSKSDWITGEALYWVLNDVAITRWSYASAPVPLFLCKLMTWGALFFELSFILLVWVRPLRRWVLLAGVGLHLGILVSMEVGWFSQATLCWYALFLRGEDVSAFFARVAGRSRREPEEGEGLALPPATV